MLASASSGQALPVCVTCRASGDATGAAAAGADVEPDVERDVERDAAGAAPAASAVGAALASVASTCCWVMTCGGCVVTIVADKRSPAWKSENWAGTPPFIILMPRFSTSLSVNCLKP